MLLLAVLFHLQKRVNILKFYFFRQDIWGNVHSALKSISFPKDL